MNDIRTEFLSELHALLKKYKAEIVCSDHWSGYAECGENVRMTVEFGNNIRSIDLGSWIDANGHGP